MSQTNRLDGPAASKPAPADSSVDISMAPPADMLGQVKDTPSHTPAEPTARSTQPTTTAHVPASPQSSGPRQPAHYTPAQPAGVGRATPTHEPAGESVIADKVAAAVTSRLSGTRFTADLAKSIRKEEHHERAADVEHTQKVDGTPTREVSFKPTSGAVLEGLDTERSESKPGSPTREVSFKPMSGSVLEGLDTDRRTATAAPSSPTDRSEEFLRAYERTSSSARVTSSHTNASVADGIDAAPAASKAPGAEPTRAFLFRPTSTAPSGSTKPRVSPATDIASATPSVTSSHTSGETRVARFSSHRDELSTEIDGGTRKGGAPAAMPAGEPDGQELPVVASSSRQSQASGRQPLRLEGTAQMMMGDLPVGTLDLSLIAR